MPMKRTLSLLALSLLLLSACSKDDETTAETSATSTTVEVNQESTVEVEEESSVELATKEKSCKNSGGTFQNSTCTCPDDTYGSTNTPIFTYDEKTGYCVDPDENPEAF